MATAAITSVSLFRTQTVPKTVLPSHTTFHLSTCFHTASLRRWDLQRGLATTLLPKGLSSDGEGDHEDDSALYPRPEEIPWNKNLANSVQLIGTVALPVQVRCLKNGKTYAWTKLRIKKWGSEGVTWVRLNFWNELAYVALNHVNKGQQIHVSGKLVCGSEGKPDERRFYCNVTVEQLNFVVGNFPPVSLDNSTPNFTTEWEEKTSYAGNQSGSIEELWQAYFVNPSEWWDNRQNKRSPRYPDFRHKETGAVLWVNERSNPPWVKSQLEILDARMRLVQENESNNSSLAGLFNEDLTDF